MVDVEDGFEFSCYIMIDFELFGIGMLNSLCSILDFELRGNESCLVDNFK